MIGKHTIRFLYKFIRLHFNTSLGGFLFTWVFSCEKCLVFLVLLLLGSFSWLECQSVLPKSDPDFFIASVLLFAFVNAGFSLSCFCLFLSSLALSFPPLFLCTSEGLLFSCNKASFLLFIPASHICTCPSLLKASNGSCAVCQMKSHLYLPQFKSEISSLVHSGTAFASFTTWSYLWVRVTIKPKSLFSFMSKQWILSW